MTIESTSPAAGTPNTDAAVPVTTEGTPDVLANTTPVAPVAPGEVVAKAPESDGKAADGVQPGAPEKYDFAMPEGVELDGKAADEFSVLAKELKLSQADAQRVANVAVKMQQQQAETHASTVKGWADQCKTDKEFGGDNLEPNMAVARKAIDTFGSPELKTLLNSSGLGNHPELVRFAFKAGKAVSEDTFVRSGSRAPTPEMSMEKRLYPNMN